MCIIHLLLLSYVRRFFSSLQETYSNSFRTMFCAFALSIDDWLWNEFRFRDTLIEFILCTGGQVVNKKIIGIGFDVGFDSSIRRTTLCDEIFYRKFNSVLYLCVVGALLENVSHCRCILLEMDALRSSHNVLLLFICIKSNRVFCVPFCTGNGSDYLQYPPSLA